MKEVFGKGVTPFVYPIREDGEFKGFVDVIDMTARRYEGQDRLAFKDVQFKCRSVIYA
jgi:elongation factor G